MSLVDYRWDDTFELFYGQEDIQIQQGINYYSIEYDLIPHEAPITSNITFEANMVSRFKPTLTGNSTMTVSDGVRIDMYNSEIIIEPGSTLALGNNVVIKGKRGVNRITIRGNAVFGTNVSFIAEEGAHLFIDFENTNLSATINSGYFERINLNVSCHSLSLVGTTVLSDNNNRLCVKRGAMLINNNSLFSNFGDKMWRGIEVWGNSNVEQVPTTNQGIVKIISGGIIENAECGIRTWKPEALPDGTETLDPDKDYFGGIVMADDATFINNKIAVEFLPYEYKNYSYFENCAFETTAALPDNSVPKYFVSLYSVSDIYFKGCSFKNSYTGFTNLDERGIGIYASESDVIVDHLCMGGTTPCNNYKASSFTSLYRGIYATGAEKQRLFRVQNSEFSYTVKGIYLSSIDFAEINLNHFQVWNEVVSLNPIGCSLYLDACTGFTIEENTFINPDPTRRGIGLIINESGADNNMVYNNHFERLNFATIAQGYNRSGSSGVTGLCYKCNDFVDNDNDVRMSRRNSNVLSQQDGIAYYQGKNEPGNNLAPAGNTFTTVTNSKDISNSCNWIVYYRHNTGPASILPSPADLTTHYRVFATTYTKSISCPSHLGTGTEKSEAILKMELANEEAASTQTSLDAVIDGGSTPNLQSEVITSIPEEGLDLRDQLLSESPFLSDVVIESSISKEDVLNNAMIRDVMVANPQSAKSAQMVEMLDARVNPMTEEMKNEILAGQTIPGEKENLEAELSFWKQEAWYNFGTLCRLYANDTLHTWQSDTIGVLLAGESTPEARYKLAFWHWFKGNPTTATQVLNNVPAEFALDAAGLELHTRYTTLLNTLIQFGSNPDLVLQTGTDTYEALMQLSMANEDKPAAISRNLLLSAGLISYEEPIKLDDGLKTMPIYKPGGVSAKSSKLTVYPNPANTFVTVAWNTPEQNNVLLSIYDAGGRIVVQQKLQGKNNETILDITGFVNGTYKVSLSQGNKTIATEKLVITK